MHDEVILDSRIRDWVLLPLLLFMVVLSIFRSHFTKLVSAPSTKPDLKQIKDGQILIRASRVRAFGNNIPVEAFKARRQYFVKEALVLPPKDPNPFNAMMNNPNQSTANMMDMMKRNLSNVIIQPLVMTWISYFFSGFVVVKIPFPLFQRFRIITQRGVEQLADLDVSYVSSLSWYFLVLFGMMGINTLLLGAGDEMTMMVDPATSAMMQMGGGAGVPDPHSVFPAEKENLEIHKHEWIGDNNFEVNLMKRSGFSL